MERCYRSRNGVYEIVTVNKKYNQSINDDSVLIKNNVYCNMDFENGGWELVMNNINGDGWSSAQILQRYFSFIYKFILIY